jgi:hypothetical protein
MIAVFDNVRGKVYFVYRNLSGKMLPRIYIACFLFLSCSSSRMMETDLYFGQTRPDGTMITAQEWNAFAKTDIPRVFREGSTTISATGSWYDSAAGKLISEPSYLVRYVYKKSPQTSREIDSLRSWYQQKFRQQSVLRVDKKVRVYF